LFAQSGNRTLHYDKKCNQKVKRIKFAKTVWGENRGDFNH